MASATKSLSLSVMSSLSNPLGIKFSMIFNAFSCVCARVHTYLGSFHLPTPFPSAGDATAAGSYLLFLSHPLRNLSSATASAAASSSRASPISHPRTPLSLRDGGGRSVVRRAGAGGLSSARTCSTKEIMKSFRWKSCPPAS